jgi:hypothetical protein
MFQKKTSLSSSLPAPLFPRFSFWSFQALLRQLRCAEEESRESMELRPSGEMQGSWEQELKHQ